MRSSVPAARAATADLTLVNLAAPVADGQQIVVPTRVARRRERRRRLRRAVAAKVSLASATLEQLDALARNRAGDGAEDPRLAPDARAAALGRRPRRDPRHRAGARRAAARPGDAVSRRASEALDRGWPAVALGAARARARRGELDRVPAGWPGSPRASRRSARRSACRRSSGSRSRRSPSAALGLWWGGLRLHELDRSYLASRIGEPGRRAGRRHGRREPVSPFAVRVTAEVRRFDGIELRERVLLELPAGRAPPQGAVLELRARPVAPRGPETGFDERGWLARRGIHVVLHASGPWRVVGRRGGIGGVGDRLRTAIGERPRARDDQASGGRSSSASCSAPTRASIPELRDAFKASGLYHLLAVSGQNIVLIGFGVLGLAYVARARPGGRSHARDRRDPRVRARRRLAAVGRPRGRGGLPRVARVAAVAPERPLAHDGDGGGGAARVDAALAARAGLPALVRRGRRDLPHAAAAAPLARGLSGAARRSSRWSASRPPAASRRRRSSGSSSATIPLWTVPANALAEPAMPVLLGCGLGAAVLAPVIPPAAVALSWLAGAAAAWIAFSARLDRVAAVRADVVADARPRARGRRSWPSSALQAAAAVPAARRGRHRRRARAARRGSAGGRCTRPRRGRRRPGCASRSSTSARATGSCSRRRRERCSSTPARPRRASTGSCARMGLHALAAIVITHAHRDHVGGAPAVLRSPDGRRGDRPDAARRRGPTSATMRRDGASARRAARPGPRRARRTRSGGSGCACSGPTTPARPTRIRTCTAPSLLASYGSIDLLLTGDSESAVTRSLPLRRVEVLKVAHHGSSDPGLADELRGAAAPRRGDLGRRPQRLRPPARRHAGGARRSGPGSRSTAPTRTAASCSSRTAAR